MKNIERNLFNPGWQGFIVVFIVALIFKAIPLSLLFLVIVIVLFVYTNFFLKASFTKEKAIDSNKESIVSSGFITERTEESPVVDEVFQWEKFERGLTGNLKGYEWAILNAFNLDVNAKMIALENSHWTFNDDQTAYQHYHAVLFEADSKIVLIIPESKVLLSEKEQPFGIEQLNMLKGLRMNFNSLSDAMVYAEINFSTEKQWMIKRYEND